MFVTHTFQSSLGIDGPVSRKRQLYILVRNSASFFELNPNSILRSVIATALAPAHETVIPTSAPMNTWNPEGNPSSPQLIRHGCSHGDRAGLLLLTPRSRSGAGAKCLLVIFPLVSHNPAAGGDCSVGSASFSFFLSFPGRDSFLFSFVRLNLNAQGSLV